jgi:hypothetical protein
MPWKPSDAHKHKKGLTKKQAEKWAEIANEVYRECKKNNGKDCEGKAIRIANSKVGSSKNSEGESDDMNKKKLTSQKGRFTFFADEPLVELKEQDEDGKPQSFSMVAYTGNIMPDIFGGSIAVDIEGIEFGGKKRYPILEDHWRDFKIGVSNSKPSTDGQVFFDNIKILSNEKAQEFATNLRDGFPYQASISIRPLKIEEVPEGESAEVNGKKLKGPGIVVRTSKFREASVCVFGRDENTKVKGLSDDQEEFEVEIVNFSSNSSGDAGVKGPYEFEANTPDYDGVEEKDWSKVKKDMNSVLDSYYKHNPEEETKKSSIKKVTDMPADMKRWIADLTLDGDDNASSWKSLFSYPVVNHSTKKLNKNGVESAKAYAEQENRSDIKKAADRLWKKHWGKKNDKDKNDNSDGGEAMDLEQLKEQYPDLHKQIMDQFAEKDQEIERLKSENQNLSDSKKQYEDRIKNLEKAEQMRREKDLRDQANSIIDSHLQASSIPERLFSKVKKQLDHNDYVDQEGVLDTQKFSEAVQNEVKEWDDSIKQFSSGSVEGFSSTGKTEQDKESEKYSQVADELLSFIGGKEEKKSAE